VFSTVAVWAARRSNVAERCALREPAPIGCAACAKAYTVPVAAWTRFTDGCQIADGIALVAPPGWQVDPSASSPISRNDADLNVGGR
jgi:hypothetical protein